MNDSRDCAELKNKLIAKPVGASIARPCSNDFTKIDYFSSKNVNFEKNILQIVDKPHFYMIL